LNGEAKDTRVAGQAKGSWSVLGQDDWTIRLLRPERGRGKVGSVKMDKFWRKKKRRAAMKILYCIIG